MDINIIIPIGTSVLTVIATLVITYLVNKNTDKGKLTREVTTLSTQLDNERNNRLSLESQLKKINVENLSNKKVIDNLNTIKLKYEKTNAILEKSAVVRTLSQPVIIMGPRGVGKTALVVQLHAPWIHEKLKASIDHKHSEVPIFDFIEKDLTNHFANSDLKVQLHTHLVLDMHDFPGDFSAQTQIKETILEQAKEIKYRTGKNLGLVLVCMFNSEEAGIGISDVTRQYYNGDLFRQIKCFVTDDQISIDRLIFVFNFFDKLEKLKPEMNGSSLRNYCLDKFSPIFNDLNRICNHDKVCEIFTVLGGEEIVVENRGGTVVKGECSRKFVSFFVDEIKIKEIIPDSATNNASKYFM